MRVLIVDDEFFARKAMIKMIKEWDSDTIILSDVETGQEALDCIEAEVPNLLIADIRIPEPDGLELARYMCENHPACKVIIISGHAELQDILKEIDYEGVHCLMKPVKKSELFRQLDNIFSK